MVASTSMSGFALLLLLGFDVVAVPVSATKTKFEKDGIEAVVGVSLMQIHKHKARTQGQQHARVARDALVANMKVSFTGILQKWKHDSIVANKRVTATKGALDKFIRDQLESGDACHARLLEAKRAMDGLLHKVQTLQKEVNGHTEILVTAREDLRVSQEEIRMLKLQMERTITDCKADREAARKEHEDFERELEELRQIANPKVRHDVMDAAAGGASASMALLANSRQQRDQVQQDHVAKKEEVWTKAQCESFTAWTKKRQGKDQHDSTKKNDNCDEEREQLQEAFEEAYREIMKLSKDALDRANDESCEEMARSKFTAETVALVTTREEASKRIEVTSADLAAVSPVLASVRERLETLALHIRNNLNPECEDAGLVSTHLDAVRKLIQNLEECPGRDDFKLKIPTEEEEPQRPSRPTLDLGMAIPQIAQTEFTGAADEEEITMQQLSVPTDDTPPAQASFNGNAEGALTMVTDEDDNEYQCLVYIGTRGIRLGQETPGDRECVHFKIRQEEHFLHGREHQDHIAFKIESPNGKCLDWYGYGYNTRQCMGGASMNFDYVSPGLYCLFRGPDWEGYKEECVRLYQQR